MNMLTRAAAAMWHERADEPLQVGQFKEPSDYRSYSDLGAPAQGSPHLIRKTTRWCPRLVNHIDRDRQNNRVENLEWLSRADNFAHGRATGNDLAKCNPRVRHKISAEAVEEIKRLRPLKRRTQASGEIARSLSAKYGVNSRYIRRIWSGEKRARG